MHPTERSVEMHKKRTDLVEKNVLAIEAPHEIGLLKKWKGTKHLGWQ
jgi:hypothetical protein